MSTLTCCGGVGAVTGANFLFEVNGLKILIDCGMLQGVPQAEDFNRGQFPYDPASIDYLLITHAHIDHIGRVPKLVKEGFAGKIYSTLATQELAPVMLFDAERVGANEARSDGVLAMYEKKDVEKALSLWRGFEYHQEIDLGQSVSIYMKESGHILGSAMIEVRHGGKKIVFTGDLGNSPSLFLKDTEMVSDADYMVMESVYGDRNHESKEERRAKLKKVILESVQRGGTLMIPAFSLERTQDILYEINSLVENNEIKPVPVFIDSPLGIKITEIYKKRSTEFKEEAKKLIASGDDIFSFRRLHLTPKLEDSFLIESTPGPKIIIAGSGMSNGGRILRHEKHYLPDPKATILLVGYQSVGTIGRQIQDGAKTIIIDSTEVPIRAKVETILGYSSHKDSDHLIEFVAATKDRVKKVFVAMGEPKAALFLVQRLRDYLGVDAVFPSLNQKYELDM